MNDVAGWETQMQAVIVSLGIHCAQLSFGEASATYVVFSANLIPTAYSDDAPEYDRVLVQLHLFAPMTQNTTQMRKDIKHAVFDAFEAYPSEQDASEEETQHIVFEFETLQGTEVGE